MRVVGGAYGCNAIGHAPSGQLVLDPRLHPTYNAGDFLPYVQVIPDSYYSYVYITLRCELFQKFCYLSIHIVLNKILCLTYCS